MPANAPRRRSKIPPHGATPAATGQEALYLRFLSDKQVPVNVKLRDGEVVSGWIEYFDETMIRLTREGKPNLFIYKEQIRTISELIRREEGRRRTALRKAAAAAAQGSSEGTAERNADTPPEPDGAALGLSQPGELSEPQADAARPKQTPASEESTL